MTDRKMICNWRVSRARPFGLQVWFDPKTEVIRLYELDPQEGPGVGEGREGDDRDGSDDSDQRTLDLDAPVEVDLPF